MSILRCLNAAQENVQLTQFIHVKVFYSICYLNFRPDNWVMFDAMQIVPLPRMPQIPSEHNENSNEMPRPITSSRNAPAA